jgi:hypothetical protein
MYNLLTMTVNMKQKKKKLREHFQLNTDPQDKFLQQENLRV